MARRTILFDRAGWMEDDQAVFATRGEVVDMPDGEAERLDRLGATGPEDARPRQAATSVAAAAETTPLTAEQVADMSAVDLRGYLAARPDQATHVAALEASRPEDERRPSIVGLSPVQVTSDQPTVAASQEGEGTPAPGELTQERLEAMTVSQVRAYVDANPDDRQRVVEMEQSRPEGDRRRGVVNLADGA